MSVDSYRNTLARLNKEKSKLQEDSVKISERINKICSDINRITRSITKNTSLSSRNSKQRQIETKQKEITRLQKNYAAIQTKIAKKIEDITRATKNLNRALEIYTKKKRTEEINHLRVVSKEKEKQLAMQKELSRNPLTIRMEELPEKIKVLFLASNPKGSTPLSLDEEIRSIKKKIKESEYRDSVEIISEWAVRPLDILQAINEHNPTIIHFSGHGAQSSDLVLSGNTGEAKLVSPEAITQTMKTTSESMKLVVFNSCFSSGQAESVVQHIDLAIGMNKPIGDLAAIVFASQFYSSLGFGHSILKSFEQAKAALMLEGTGEEGTPELFYGEHIDPNGIYLVKG
ncbi:hypothetical protein PM10SUCC1_28900 [Propionigenium maris DSM 9537]|uniref:CHAT domain-containing protein n=1 Tax=Propionigenium maris DSM 9537 TaxID=1123000 RepID=A0A9W6LNH9_9FUSO|nr:CHAT domain-containing protein [Propionigenium maris]GLI57376.1 hypothetical protein PM10SUCC1_28900 [Propionigenium maris DSM 9537]